MISFYIRILNDSQEEMIGAQNALKEFVGYADTSYAKKFEEFYIGFEGRCKLYNFYLFLYNVFLLMQKMIVILNTYINK